MAWSAVLNTAGCGSSTLTVAAHPVVIAAHADDDGELGCVRPVEDAGTPGADLGCDKVVRESALLAITGEAPPPSWCRPPRNTGGDLPSSGMPGSRSPRSKAVGPVGLSSSCTINANA